MARRARQGLPVLARIGEIKWRPEVGDPTVSGWVVTLAYAGAFLLCARRLVRPEAGHGSDRWLWGFYSLALLGFGLNKQLDLHELLKEVGQTLVARAGWYGQRRYIQWAFAAGVAAVALTGFGLLWHRAPGFFRRHRILLAGTALWLVFLLVCLAAFEHVGELWGRRQIRAEWRWGLEVTAVLLIGFGAAFGQGSQSATGSTAK